MKRQLISSGSQWEQTIGYSRAVRVGDFLSLSGTTAVNDQGEVVGKNAPGEQTRFILQKIKTILEANGVQMEHVVRTRMFVTDMSRWEEVGRAHGEFFSDIRPATSILEVSRLINPDLMVEIEVDAIISG